MSGGDRREVWIRRGGALLTVACLAFLVQRLARHADELPRIVWGWRAALAAVAGALLVLAIAAAHALAWQILVRGVAHRATWRESFAICGRAQLAKYLPGNVFQYVQLVALARRQALAVPAATAITAVDAVLVAVAAAVVALAAAGRVRALPVAWAAPAVALVAAAAVLGAALLWSRGRALVASVRGVFAPRRLALALAVDAALFVIPGVLLSVLLHGVWPGASTLRWSDFVPGFALGFLLGYLSPGSPGGAGPREAVLYALYQPVLGSALAAGLFLLARVVFVAGDVLTFAAAVALSPPERDRGRSGS